MEKNRRYKHMHSANYVAKHIKNDPNDFAEVSSLQDKWGTWQRKQTSESTGPAIYRELMQQLLS